eukprot:m51a1_g391 hypothetical protein (300) ;mRNA; r:698059-699229
MASMSSSAASGCPTGHLRLSCESVHEAHELVVEHFFTLPTWIRFGVELPPKSIVDDTLVIRTEAIVCADPSRCVPTRPAAAPEANAGAFPQGMAQLLASGQGSDAVIVAGQSQRRFPVHRAVVAAHSPVLRAALWGNGCGAVFAEQRAGEVRLEDVDEGLVGVLIEFLYTGASASDVPGAPVDLYMQLAMLADRLDVAMLRDLWATRVAQRISAERLADVLVLADSCRMGSLRDACVQWVACHRHVLRMPGVLEALGSDACPGLEQHLVQSRLHASDEHLPHWEAWNTLGGIHIVRAAI